MLNKNTLPKISDNLINLLDYTYYIYSEILHFVRLETNMWLMAFESKVTRILFGFGNKKELQ